MVDNFFTYGILLIIFYLISIVAIVQIKNDTSIANFTWGGGAMLVAFYTLFATQNFLARPILITALIFLWAMRLIIYLYVRYTGKDPRFKKWKMEGLKALVVNIGYIFIGQLCLLVIMSIPGYQVNIAFKQPNLGILDYLGLSIWIFGFIFESFSDYQLFKFLKKPENKGHVMESGLWRYSRHPNYFGEAVMWWGVFLIAVNVPYGLISIISPITITILLRFISGVPLLENAMKDNPEYQEYKKHTNIFIPWFVK